MKKHYSQDELAEIQIQREISMRVSGIERFTLNNQRAVDDGAASDTQWNRRLIQDLVAPMAEAIDIYLDYYKGRRGKPSKTLTYLRSLSSQQAAYITIKNILDSLTRETECVHIARTIGSRIEDQVRFAGVAAAAPKYVEKVKDALKKNNSMKYKHQVAVLSHANDKLVKGDEDREIEGKPELRWAGWPEQDIVQLGSQLITIFTENVLFNGEAIVYKRVLINGKKNKAFITPTEYMKEWIDQYVEIMQVLAPAFAPCVVPPRDWTSPVNGGYYISEIADTLPLVKCKKKQRKRLTKKQMPKVYKAINKLQNVGWQVNDDILDVALEVAHLGLPFGMPSKEPIIIPESPVDPDYADLHGLDLKEIMSKEEWDEFTSWKRNVTALHTMNNKRKSEFIKISRVLGAASQYREFEKIYFVYTMDFRGRVYCKTDSVSPQGDDIQKGLIRFAKGKALGTTGYKWLAIQGAGTWGNDKCTFEERIAFIEERTDDIRDIAADPLTFTAWAAADKPFQYLAWCKEWAAMHDFIEDGGKVEDFVSHIPIAMDGSCSGIQHYSAILRDPIGGAAVNLVPDDHPHDIYGDVAKVTDRLMHEIMSEGIAEARDRQLAKEESELAVKRGELAQGWLSIGIDRYVTKQPVMTLPYGSTQMRCLDTTGQYLTDLQEKEDKRAYAEGRVPREMIPFSQTKEDTRPSRYDAEKLGSATIWKSIGEVVVAARAGMKFIQQVASFVAKAGCHFEAVAPTGFIMEQREMDYKRRVVKTQLLGETFMSLKEELTTYNPRKMRSSSAPNFIHLMDASHLILAVCHFDDAGIDDIEVIHDSFGTYACDTDLLRERLTDSFVRMYQEHDVLAELIEVNEWNLLAEIEVDTPETMGLDLEVVRQSTYCFS